MDYDTSVENQYPDFYEDISSVSSPEYYGEGEENKDEVLPEPNIELNFDANFEQTIILEDLGKGIFDESFEDDPVDFSYQPDFDAYFDDDITTD
jgi:hypothetical protein